MWSHPVEKEAKGGAADSSSRLLQSWAHQGQLTLQFLSRGWWHLGVTMDPSAPGGHSPQAPLWKRSSALPSAPQRAAARRVLLWNKCICFNWTPSPPARDVEYCWKAALSLPARLSLTEQSKKPAYIAEIFRPTCALPLHPLSKSRVWKWMCSFSSCKREACFSLP